MCNQNLVYYTERVVTWAFALFMISICVFNRKGGVGKTTITVNLAAALSLYHRKKVLIVDCDSQGNATSYLNASGENDNMPGLADFLNGGIRETGLAEYIQHYHFVKKNFMAKSQPCDIDLISGGPDLDSVEIEDGKVLQKAVRELDYDFIFFDCPPAMSDASVAAMFAADYVLVPALLDSDSLGGFQYLVDTLTDIKTAGHEIEIVGILFNQYNSTAALDKYLLDELREGMPKELLFETLLPRATTAKNCRQFGVPVCVRESKSKLGTSYEMLAKELLQKVG